jgi:hypothetical protein
MEENNTHNSRRDFLKKSGPHHSQYLLPKNSLTNVSQLHLKMSPAPLKLMAKSKVL